jgi:membrane protease YdiL (CAAX protease family)
VSFDPVQLLLAAPAAPSILPWLIRLGTGAVVGGLIYVLLGEPGEPLTSQPLRRLSFAAMSVCVAQLLLSQPGGAARGNPGRAFEAYSRAVVDARSSFCTSALLRREKGDSGPISMKRLEDAIRQYEAAMRAYPDAATYRREIAVLYAAAGRWQEARAAALAAADLMAARRQPQAARERSVWEVVYAPQPPAPGLLPALDRDLQRVPLGWYRGVLRYALAVRAGERDAAADELEAISRSANVYMFHVVLIAVAEFGLLLMGLILLVAVGVLIGTGVLRPVPARRAGVSSILWEGFVLYMLLSTVPAIPRILAGTIGRGHDRTPGVVVGTALLTDGLGLLALGYLAWRLRRRSLTLAEMGLHLRRPFSDAAWGLAGYVATLPLLLVVALATEELTRRFFPNVSPPYHPVAGLMMASQGVWTRIGLFALVAVGAPFFEEFFFRGALYGALRRRFGVLAGALGSAAIFAVLHPQLPLGFLPIFLLGAVFALLYEWRQSLVPGMVMHGANNGVIFVVMTLMFPNSG